MTKQNISKMEREPTVWKIVFANDTLEKCLFRSFAHLLIGLFAFLEWSCMSSLYIWEIKSLSKVSLANMFSHTFGSLFTLPMSSLAVQMLFNLMRSYLFILSFMSLALGDISVKILLHGIPTVENSMEFPQKTKNGTAFSPSHSPAGVIP